MLYFNQGTKCDWLIRYFIGILNAIANELVII